MKLAENLRFLREQTGVHVHTDLIVGLPGETIESFGRGFDRLVALRPQEIQVGILKRLRGTPIVRHDADFGMVYSLTAPYEVLQTKHVSFDSMQRMRRLHVMGRAGEIDICSRCCTTIPHPALVAGSLLFHGKTVRRLLPLIERMVYSSKLPKPLLTPSKLVEISAAPREKQN